MTFLQRLRSTFGRKDSQARVLISLSNGGKYVPTPRNYEGFAKEGFQNNVIAYRAISLVSRNLSTIPWVLYQKGKGKNSKRKEIDSHPLLDLLDRPNPMQGGSQFLEAVEGYKLISGNSYLNAVGPTEGAMKKITELWTNRPDRMTILPGSRGFPQAYIYKIGGLETRFPVDQVKLQSQMLHLKFFHPTNDWYGLSPMEAAAMSVDQHNAANKWNAGLLQNSARPSGALVATVSERSSGNLTDEQFKRLKNQIDEQMSGAENAGRPLILEAGMDWKTMSFTPQAMEWLESKNTSARDVALGFGVPPMMLGIPGDNTYSNYQEARVSLYQETVIPEHDFIRDEFNHWLVPTFGDGLELDSNKDAVHALAPVRQMVWDKVASATWLTVNEKREATGYEEVGPEGDVILTPATNVSLEQVLEEPEPQVPMSTVAPAGAKPPDPNAKPDAGADPEDDTEDDAEPGKMLEAKLFNLTSDRAKQREARGQLRLRARYSKRLHRQAQATFDMEGHTIAELVKGLDADHAKYVAKREIDANKYQWTRILTANLTATAKGFGDRTLNAFKSAPGALELKDSTSAFDVWLKNWVKDHVGKRITQISETSKERVLKAIRDAQNDGYDQGEGVDSLSAKIQGVYSDFSDSRAMTIARTETGTAANIALNEAARSSGVPNLQKEWVAVNDARTREDHADVNGTVIDMDDLFDVGGAKMAQPMDPNGPPEEVINCFLPGTLVRGVFASAVRSKYVGPAFEVITRSGQRLRVTPNHPVLTDKGLVPACELRKSDYLIADSHVVDAKASLSKANNKHKPSLIEDVFEAIRIRGSTLRHHLGANDLHGDSRWIKGEVDIVGAYRALGSECKSASLDHPVNVALVKELMGFTRLPSDCPLDSTGHRILASTPGFPGSRELFAYSAGALPELRPLQLFGCAPSPKLDALLGEMRSQCAPGNALSLRKLIDRSAAIVLPDEILEIREFQFSGHVYDLQSTTGLLIADNLITSNCRCATVFSRGQESDDDEGAQAAAG